MLQVKISHNLTNKQCKRTRIPFQKSLILPDFPSTLPQHGRPLASFSKLTSRATPFINHCAWHVHALLSDNAHIVLVCISRHRCGMRRWSGKRIWRWRRWALVGSVVGVRFVVVLVHVTVGKEGGLDDVNNHALETSWSCPPHCRVLRDWSLGPRWAGGPKRFAEYSSTAWIGGFCMNDPHDLAMEVTEASRSLGDLSRILSWTSNSWSSVKCRYRFQWPWAMC